MSRQTRGKAVAVVTGGAQGIGRAAAEALAARGDRVVILNIREAAPDEGILPLVCDVTDETQVEAAFARIATDYGRVDALVTSAGVVAVAPAMTFDTRELDRIMSVDVTGSCLPARVAARTMEAQGAGSIVLIGSVYGSGGAPRRTAYCASKGAVENMARSLAVEWGPLGIRVNVEAPTGTRTPMIQDLIDRGAYDLEGVEGRTPLGRLADPEEVANAIAFLCSPEAQMSSGAVLPVDGGWIAKGFVQKRKN